MNIKLIFAKEYRFRVGLIGGVGIMLVSELILVMQPIINGRAYALGLADSLLLPINQTMASKLQYSQSDQTFNFNADYQLPSANSLGATGVQAKATISQDLTKGLTVTDPLNNVNFTMTPKFATWQGKQDGNRIVYPLETGIGWVVYSMHSVGVKEDLVLNNYVNNQMSFNYTLSTGSGLVAKVERDGSIGIYGNSLFSSNIVTGTAKDAALLKKARQNAPKNTLFFSIPAPTIKVLDSTSNNIKATYSLAGKDLKVTVTGLAQAHYPLTIDPSIYVSTAQQFMAGNNETNINFDVADQLIDKGPTTGAWFNTWNTTTNSNYSVYGQAATAAGGYIYTAGGTQTNGSTNYYTSPGTSTYTVPSGITSINVKTWGAGGGGGGGGVGGTGGNGGGGGFVQSTLTVTPGQQLTVDVGKYGSHGSFSSGTAGQTSGDGGGGGGYSGIFSSGTPLLIGAGGAGGGGGGDGAYAGGAAGAAGGVNGVTGNASNGAGGGGGGTASAGGTAGTGGSNNGLAGNSLTGGAGANGGSSSAGTGSNMNGGTFGGANGGNGDANAANYAGGGGGGGGYYGGGGGSGAKKSGNQFSGGGGGGGGSSYTTGNNTTDTGGSGTVPGNASDTNRGNAGGGGDGGAISGVGSDGNSGLVIISYGSGASDTNTVNFAQLDTNNGAIDSPNPGNGVCSGWCSMSNYALPVARTNLSLVAYNSFLYAIGGEDSSCTTGNSTGDSGICNTVYIAKLGANGEPSLWSPTSSNQATWTYWYQDTALPSARSYTQVLAYENHMYLIGGKTSSNGVTSIVGTVQLANITATGQLGTWSNLTSLPYNDYGFGAQIYNNQLYLIGGDSSVGGSPLSNVYYNTINSDGTLNSWTQTSSLVGGRFTNGGNFTAIWGGYIYLGGGCSAVNASGFCTTVAGDTQIASINANGSLDQWFDDTSVTYNIMANNLVVWQNYLYTLDGCTTQNTTNGTCSTASANSYYGTINQPGDVSQITQSVAGGTAPCSGSAPYNCNLPPVGQGAGQGGQMLSATAVINGYLYVGGGCTSADCSSVSTNTSYSLIGSTGRLTAPSSCTADGNTLYGDWCVDSTHIFMYGNLGSGQIGVAGAASAVFNNTFYVIGGFNGSGETGYIYYDNVNTDGSLSANWSYETIGTAGGTAVAYAYAYARANPNSAGTIPGNLYIFGGCTALSGLSCTAYTGAVYKCNIGTNAALTGCTTTGQLQFGTAAGAAGVGIAGTGGTVYANYIYLIGGIAPGVGGLNTIYYASLDSNNNVVSATGGGWALASNTIPVATEFDSAFGYNGNIYVIGGYNNSSGILGSIYFAKVNVSNGDINSFNQSLTTISPSWGTSLIPNGSYVYDMGGCSSGSAPASCSVIQANVQSFKIFNNDSGAPASYTTAANTYSTDPNRIGASSVILNGYIYVAGGCISTTDCTTAVNDVSYASIGVNGALGAWTSTTAALPNVRTWGALEASGGSLYYIGGQSSTATDIRAEIYYATPSSGNITTWATATNGLPAARTKFGAAVWNNRLYVVGGLNSSSATTNTVYVSPQLSSGGNITSAWSTSSTPFNVARSGLTVVAYADNLYIFGGYDGANFLNDGQYAKISPIDGSVGGWSYTTNLPVNLSGAQGFAANGYIYIIGGETSANTSDQISLVAPISANTSVSSGNNPTGVGDWYQASQLYSGSRYGDAVVYAAGNAYVIGGATVSGGTLTYANPSIQQTAILSQPQVADYSIMIDTSSDVYPNYWLLNGLDDSISAEWRLTYSSMTNITTSCTTPAMTNWGQPTNFGNVTLGTPEVYIPKDGNGNNIHCARFYFFNVSIDSSQTYGYPEDVSREPTITDLTLQFTADPSKRLMHGRTFTGGMQQPDDSPYYSY